MRIVITGSSGFIARHLIAHLLEYRPGCKILGLDLCAPQNPIPGVDYRIADIADPDSLKALDLSGYDACVHLAALCKEPGYEWGEYFRVNYEGTKEVVKLCDRFAIKNMVFTSTMMVFRPGDRACRETDFCSPDTAYGISKLLAEEVVSAWSKSGNRLRVIRPGVVFGLGERGNFTRLYNALRKKCFAFIGRRQTIKSCVYVKDLVRLIGHLLDDMQPHVLYHAAYPRPTQISHIVNAMKTIGARQRFVPVVPYWGALLASLPFSVFDPKKCPVHPRRIQKLFFSTNLSADRLAEAGFAFEYSLEAALSDWLNESGGSHLQ